MTALSLEWALGLAWVAGLSIPLGALISSHVVLRSACLRLELDSFVSYFGGGALLAAITLVLIPRGIEDTLPVFVAIAFAAGGFVFWAFSAWTRRTQNSASQFVSMLLDFLPEAILLGTLAAWVGFAFLSSGESALAMIVLFCSGGILYLIFEDIAPKAHSKRDSFPAMGAVAGFLLGLMGTMMIH